MHLRFQSRNAEAIAYLRRFCEGLGERVLDVTVAATCLLIGNGRQQFVLDNELHAEDLDFFATFQAPAKRVAKWVQKCAELHIDELQCPANFLVWRSAHALFEDFHRFRQRFEMKPLRTITHDEARAVFVRETYVQSETAWHSAFEKFEFDDVPAKTLEVCMHANESVCFEAQGTQVEFAPRTRSPGKDLRRRTWRIRFEDLETLRVTVTRALRDLGTPVEVTWSGTRSCIVLSVSHWWARIPALVIEV